MSLKPFPEMVAAAKARIAETSVEEVRRRQEAGETFTLIDVREDDEWAKGRIGGAMHLGRGIIDRDIAGTVPDPAADIVLYMAGGISAWYQAGYPVEQA